MKIKVINNRHNREFSWEPKYYLDLIDDAIRILTGAVQDENKSN